MGFVSIYGKRGIEQWRSEFHVSSFDSSCWSCFPFQSCGKKNSKLTCSYWTCTGFHKDIFVQVCEYIHRAYYLASLPCSLSHKSPRQFRFFHVIYTCMILCIYLKSIVHHCKAVSERQMLPLKKKKIQGLTM